MSSIALSATTIRNISSYAPRIEYNNNDFAVAGSVSDGIVENNPTRHIAPDDAINYTVGLSLKIKTD
jgi:hypothetical protein